MPQPTDANKLIDINIMWKLSGNQDHKVIQIAQLGDGRLSWTCLNQWDTSVLPIKCNAMGKQMNRKKAYEKESMLRTLGASGISINNEFEKKEMRLLASKLDGTSIADSFVVSNR